MGSEVLPVSVSDSVGSALNSYVCSPYAHYVAYGQHEVDKLERPWVRAMARPAVRALGAWMRRHALERVVYVNNWLLSTNLYPPLEAEAVEALHHRLVERHPSHAVVWRSVDERQHQALLTQLKRLGYATLFSRLVWFQDPTDSALWSRRNVRLDQKVLRRSGLAVIDAATLRDAAFERLADLYSQLYLQKYSEHNPDFTSRYLRELVREGALSMRALTKDDRIDAVYGYYTRAGVGTSPIFGYDLGLPPETGLYRCLSAAWTAEARDLGVQIHASAGVGRFKQHRGGVPALEYNVVFTGHLPRPRRRPWWVLQSILDRIVVPLTWELEVA